MNHRGVALAQHLSETLGLDIIAVSNAIDNFLTKHNYEIKQGKATYTTKLQALAEEVGVELQYVKGNNMVREAGTNDIFVSVGRMYRRLYNRLYQSKRRMEKSRD